MAKGPPKYAPEYNHYCRFVISASKFISSKHFYFNRMQAITVYIFRPIQHFRAYFGFKSLFEFRPALIGLFTTLTPQTLLASAAFPFSPNCRYQLILFDV